MSRHYISPRAEQLTLDYINTHAWMAAEEVYAAVMESLGRSATERDPVVRAAVDYWTNTTPQRDEPAPWASIAWEPADLMRGRQDESAGGHGYFETEAEAAAFLAQHVDAIRDASTVAGWGVIEELALMAGLHDEEQEAIEEEDARDADAIHADRLA